MKEHDGCKGCKYESEAIESSHCIGCKQNAIDKYTKKTNADFIRSMNDEELAEILFSSCTEKIGENQNCYDSTGNSCNKCTIKWLQSEVSE